jgi:hypothetical protein
LVPAFAGKETERQPGCDCIGALVGTGIVLIEQHFAVKTDGADMAALDANVRP